MSRIFISHSSTDNTQARALASWLDERGWSDDYFLDLDPERGIVAGERWLRAFMDAVTRCEAVIFLMSPAWCESHYCRLEVSAAKAQGKRLFGVIVKPVSFADPRVSEIASEWQLCDLSQPSSEFDVPRVSDGARDSVTFNAAALEQLARGLQRAGVGATNFTWPPRDDPKRQPYQGLSSLSELDGGIYFGREAAIVRALDKIRRLRERGIERLFVVLGASGSGKSSFLRAGLLPRLKNDSEHFVVLPSVRPRQAIVTGPDGLLASLLATLRKSGADWTASALGTALDTQGLTALLLPLSTAGASPRRRTIVLPVDQAEELFAPAGTKEAQRFLALLDASSALPLLVICTIRSDAWESLQGLPLLGSLPHELFSLAPMPQSEFGAVILKPAERHAQAHNLPLSLDPQLVEQLILDASDATGGDPLPMLALTLQLLFEGFTNAKRIELKLADYTAGLGGLPGVIDTAIARAFSDPRASPAIPDEGPQREAMLRAAFSCLATVDPESGTARRRVAEWREFAQFEPGVIALVTRLVDDARLLVRAVRKDSLGRQSDVVEVAHEALFRQWGVLKQFVNEYAEKLRAIELVHREALHYHRRPDEGSLNHRADRLREAERLMADPLLTGRFDVLDREYLLACRKEVDRLTDEREGEQRRRQEEAEERARNESLLRQSAERQAQAAHRQRRNAYAGAAVAVLLLIAVAVSTWQLSRSREAIEDTATALLAGSYADEDPTTAAIAIQQVLRRDMATPAARMVRTRLYDSLLTRASLEGHSAPVVRARFSPDAEALVTASADSTARIWTRQGKRLATLAGHTDAVNDVTFSPDGKTVATASDDRTARLWGADGKPLVTLSGHSGPVARAVFSPDGRLVVTVSWDGTGRLWDFAGKTLAVLEGHTGPIHQASFSPDGLFLVTASADNTARLWTVDGTPIAVLVGHQDGVVDATFSPDGQVIATASRDRTARLWTRNGRALAELRGHTDALFCVAFAPSGGGLVTGSRDNTAILWGRDGRPHAVLGGHRGSVVDVAFSAGGETVVTSSWDHTARLWSTDGKLLDVLEGHTDRVAYAAFSPDGRTLATASWDKTARLWNANGRLTVRFIGHQGRVDHTGFSPDGTSVVTTSTDKTASLWSLDGNEVATLEGHTRGVVDAAFSPDGASLVTASNDRTARVWSRDGKLRFTLTGHTGFVVRAAYSPDGQSIVTASKDSTARLWSRNGEPIRELKGHSDGLTHAAFSPDGELLVTASEDGTARLWRSDGAATSTLRAHTGGVNFAGSAQTAGRSLRHQMTASRVCGDATEHLWRSSKGTGGRLFTPHSVRTGVAWLQHPRTTPLAFGVLTEVQSQRSVGIRVECYMQRSVQMEPSWQQLRRTRPHASGPSMEGSLQFLKAT